MFLCLVAVYRHEITERFELRPISGAEQTFLFLFITCHINCYNKYTLYTNN